MLRCVKLPWFTLVHCGDRTAHMHNGRLFSDLIPYIFQTRWCKNSTLSVCIQHRMTWKAKLDLSLVSAPHLSLTFDSSAVTSFCSSNTWLGADGICWGKKKRWVILEDYIIINWIMSAQAKSKKNALASTQVLQDSY